MGCRIAEWATGIFLRESPGAKYSYGEFDAGFNVGAKSAGEDTGQRPVGSFDAGTKSISEGRTGCSARVQPIYTAGAACDKHDRGFEW